MGATGAGKSSFIAVATGKPVRIGHTLDPCKRFTRLWSENVCPYDHKKLTLGTTSPEGFDLVCLDGTAVSLIDTPGFNDFRRSDMDILT
jgi:predicted GTPase